jgi:hypothetical protein
MSLTRLFSAVSQMPVRSPTELSSPYFARVSTRVEPSSVGTATQSRGTQNNQRMSGEQAVSHDIPNICNQSNSWPCKLSFPLP